MKEVSKLSIIITRATEIYNDSRTIKLYSELKFLNKNVIGIGWNRTQENNNDNNLLLYSSKCNYGGGLKNIRKFLEFEIWLFKKLKSLKDDIDIIHACDLDTGFAVFLFSKKYKKKYNYDIFDFYIDAHHLPKWLSKIVKKMEFIVIKNAEHTILCTDERKKQIIGSTPKQIEVIYNTPNLSEINTDYQLKSSNSKIKIGYVGILQEHRLLKEIFSTIENHPEIELHIGGFGMLEKDIPVSNNVFYYGKMAYSDALGLESKCDILFATYDPTIENHKFSAPNKLYEACGLGKQIIVCEHTGIDRIVYEKKLGEVIEYDINSFWKAVNHLTKKTISNNEESLKKIYESCFSWNVMRKRIEKIYEEF